MSKDRAYQRDGWGNHTPTRMHMAGYSKYMYDNPNFSAESGKRFNRPYRPYRPSEYSTSDSTSEDSIGARRRRTKCFLVAIVIFVILLLVAAVAVGIYFALNQSKDPGPSNAKSRLQTLGGSREPDARLSLQARNLQWNPQMSDTSSTAFKETASTFEKELDAIFGTGTFAQVYGYAMVTKLRSGSVVGDVDMILIAADTAMKRAFMNNPTSLQMAISELISARAQAQVAKGQTPLFDTTNVGFEARTTPAPTTPPTTAAETTAATTEPTTAAPTTAAATTAATTTPTTIQTTMPPPPPEKELTPEINTTLKVTSEQWNSALADNTSDEFKLQAAKVEDWVLEGLKNTNASKDVANVTVVSMSPGSIVVVFIVRFVEVFVGDLSVEMQDVVKEAEKFKEILVEGLEKVVEEYEAQNQTTAVVVIELETIATEVVYKPTKCEQAVSEVSTWCQKSLDMTIDSYTKNEDVCIPYNYYISCVRFMVSFWDTKCHFHHVSKAADYHIGLQNSNLVQQLSQCKDASGQAQGIEFTTMDNPDLCTNGNFMKYTADTFCKTNLESVQAAPSDGDCGIMLEFGQCVYDVMAGLSASRSVTMTCDAQKMTWSLAGFKDNIAGESQLLNVCFRTCDPGYKVTPEFTCEECGYGSYQPDPGQSSCIPCANSMATSTRTSTSANDCTDEFIFVEGVFRLEAVDWNSDLDDSSSSMFQTVQGQIKSQMETKLKEQVDKFLEVSVKGFENLEGKVVADVVIKFSTQVGVGVVTNALLIASAGGFTIQGTSTQVVKIVLCSAGNERKSDGSCSECAKGYYHPGTAARRFKTCLKCMDGFTTAGTESMSPDACSVRNCDPGQKVTSENKCVDCELGTYQPDRAQDSCIPCDDGLSTSMPGASSQDQCKKDCEPGEKVTSENTCVPCGLGTYQPSRAQDTCMPCKDGLSTTDTGAASEDKCVKDCDPGQKVTSDNKCVDCEVGTYQPGRAQDSCIPCDDGLSTSMPGASSQDQCKRDCEPGQKVTSENKCVDCEVGTYQPERAQDSCIPCDDGLSTSMPGASSQDQCKKDCEPGEKVTAENTCVPCAIGTYQPSRAQDSCMSCEDGLSTSDPGASSEDECVRDCKPGEKVTDDNKCEQCDKGTFQAERAQNMCTSCEDGMTTRDPGATSVEACVKDCDPGQKVAADNKCVDCEVGTYQPDRAQDSCIPCGVNMTTSEPSASSPDDCIPDCETGYKITSEGKCEKCESGTYQDKRAQFSCSSCEDGFTTTEEGAVSSEGCVRDCDPGNYFTPEGTCVLCGTGTYQPERARGLCILCGDGLTTAEPGTVLERHCIRDCAPGYKVTPDNTCEECGYGSYQAERAQSSCTPCADNLATHTRVSTSADNCTTDFVAVDGVYRVEESKWEDDLADKESSAYTTWAIGVKTEIEEELKLQTDKFLEVEVRGFENLHGTVVVDITIKFSSETETELVSTANTVVSSGTYRLQGSTVKIVDIKPCTLGKELKTDGSCLQCDKGHYHTGTKARRFEPCQKCPGGFITPEPGASSLDDCSIRDCDPGHYGTADQECDQCPVGTYQPLRAKQNCTKCAEGQSTSFTGSSSASQCKRDCDPGQKVTSENKCVDCEVGTYQPDRAQDSCIPCDDGLSTSMPGASSQDQCKKDCEPGNYVTDDNQCEMCDRGAYQPDRAQDECLPCGTDMTTAEKGTMSKDMCISDCAPGYKVTPDNTCEECGYGFYQAERAQSSCTPCADKMATHTRLSTSTDDCISDFTIRELSFRFEELEWKDDYDDLESQASQTLSAEVETQMAGELKKETEKFVEVNVMGLDFWRNSLIIDVFIKFSSQIEKSIVDSANNVLKGASYSILSQTITCTEIQFCPPGEYLVVDGTCQKCPQGSFHSGSAATRFLDCERCGDKFTTAEPGSLSHRDCSLRDCDPGWRVVGDHTCKMCPVGSYQPKRAQGACETCLSGKVTPGEGSISPEQCRDSNCPSPDVMIQMIEQPCKSIIADISKDPLSCWTYPNLVGCIDFTLNSAGFVCPAGEINSILYNSHEQFKVFLKGFSVHKCSDGDKAFTLDLIAPFTYGKVCDDVNSYYYTFAECAHQLLGAPPCTQKERAVLCLMVNLHCSRAEVEAVWKKHGKQIVGESYKECDESCPVFDELLNKAVVSCKFHTDLINSTSDQEVQCANYKFLLGCVVGSPTTYECEIEEAHTLFSKHEDEIMTLMNGFKVSECTDIKITRCFSRKDPQYFPLFSCLTPIYNLRTTTEHNLACSTYFHVLTCQEKRNYDPTCDVKALHEDFPGMINTILNLSPLTEQDVKDGMAVLPSCSGLIDNPSTVPGICEDKSFIGTTIVGGTCKFWSFNDPGTNGQTGDLFCWSVAGCAITVLNLNLQGDCTASDVYAAIEESETVLKDLFPKLDAGNCKEPHVEEGKVMLNLDWSDDFSNPHSDLYKKAVFEIQSQMEQTIGNQTDKFFKVEILSLSRSSVVVSYKITFSGRMVKGQVVSVMQTLGSQTYTLFGQKESATVVGPCGSWSQVSNASNLFCSSLVYNLSMATDIDTQCNAYIGMGTCVMFAIDKLECGTRELHQMALSNEEDMTMSFPHFNTTACKDKVADWTPENVCENSNFYVYINDLHNCSLDLMPMNLTDCGRLFAHVMCVTFNRLLPRGGCGFADYVSYINSNRQLFDGKYSLCIDHLVEIQNMKCLSIFDQKYSRGTTCLSTSAMFVNASKTCGDPELAIYATALKCNAEVMGKGCTPRDVHTSMNSMPPLDGFINIQAIVKGNSVCRERASTDLDTAPPLCESDRAIVKIGKTFSKNKMLEVWTFDSNKFAFCAALLNNFHINFEVYVRGYLNQPCPVPKLVQVILDNSDAFPELDLDLCKEFPYCPSLLGKGNDPETGRDPYGATSYSSFNVFPYARMSFMPSGLRCTSFLTFAELVTPEPIPKDLRCRLYTETLRCMVTKGRYYGDTCSFLDFHQSYHGYLKAEVKSEMSYIECEATIEENKAWPPMCKDAELITRFAKQTCMPLLKDAGDTCKVWKMVTDCVFTQLNASSIHCCKEAVGRALISNADVIKAAYTRHDFSQCGSLDTSLSSPDTSSDCTQIFLFGVNQWCPGVLSKFRENPMCSLRHDLSTCMQYYLHLDGQCKRGDMDKVLDGIVKQTTFDDSVCSALPDVPAPDRKKLCGEGDLIELLATDCLELLADDFTTSDDQTQCRESLKVFDCAAMHVNSLLVLLNEDYECDRKSIRDADSSSLSSTLSALEMPVDECLGQEIVMKQCSEISSLDSVVDGCWHSAEVQQELNCSDLYKSLECVLVKVLPNNYFCSQELVYEVLLKDRPNLLQDYENCHSVIPSDPCKDRALYLVTSWLCPDFDHLKNTSGLTSTCRHMRKGVSCIAYNLKMRGLSCPVRDILSTLSLKTWPDITHGVDPRRCDGFIVEAMSPCPTQDSSLEDMKQYCSAGINQLMEHKDEDTACGIFNLMILCLKTAANYNFMSCTVDDILEVYNREPEAFGVKDFDHSQCQVERPPVIRPHITNICQHQLSKSYLSRFVCKNFTEEKLFNVTEQNFCRKVQDFGSCMQKAIRFFGGECAKEDMYTVLDKQPGLEYLGCIKDCTGKQTCDIHTPLDPQLAECFEFTHEVASSSWVQSVGHVCQNEWPKVIGCIQDRLYDGGALCESWNVVDRLLIHSQQTLKDQGLESLNKCVHFNFPSVCESKSFIKKALKVCRPSKCGSESGTSRCIQEKFFKTKHGLDCSGFKIDSQVEEVLDEMGHQKCSEGDMRVGDSGFLEIFYNYQWGAVCESPAWDDSFAQQFCQDRGYSYGISRTGYNYSYSLRLNVTCDSPSLQNCDYTPMASWMCDRLSGINCREERLEVRLTNERKGWVYVERAGRVGHICDSSGWNNNDASSVCHSLSFASGDVFKPPSSSLPLSLAFKTRIECQESKSDINSCIMGDQDDIVNILGSRRNLPHWGDCSSERIAGVYCYDTVRFHRKFDSSYGILMFVNGTEKTTVCVDAFDDSMADIACEGMGYSKGGKVLPYNPFPVSTWSYVNLTCSLGVKSLTECQQEMSGYCPSGPAVVVCDTDEPKVEDLKIKIEKKSKGRVLVSQHSIYGTICSDQWTDREAEVVCQSRGFDFGLASKHTNEEEDMPIWFHRISCDGSSRFEECDFTTRFSTGGCNGSTAAVHCFNRDQFATYEIEGGKEDNHGFLYATINNDKRALCGYWYKSSIKPLCRSLNYTDGDIYTGDLGKPTVEGSWSINGLFCSGEERNIQMCESQEWKKEKIDACHQQIAKVFCYGDVKLHSGYSKNTGRILAYNGRTNNYEHFCADSFNEKAAEVACQELGISQKGFLISPHTFKWSYESTGRKNVSCDPADDERNSLNKCSLRGNEYCQDQTFATIVCDDTASKDDAIEEFKVEEDGVVLARRYGIWGSVCSEGWSTTQANVVCRMQGFDGGFRKQVHRDDYRPQWVGSVSCSGSENSLTECDVTMNVSRSCAYSYLVAGVRCYRHSDLASFHWNPTTKATIGHVVARWQNNAYPICDTGYSYQLDGNLLCQLFGFQEGIYRFGKAPSLTGQKVWRTSLSCPPGEKDLNACIDGLVPQTYYMNTQCADRILTLECSGANITCDEDRIDDNSTTFWPVSSCGQLLANFNTSAMSDQHLCRIYWQIVNCSMETFRADGAPQCEENIMKYLKLYLRHKMGSIAPDFSHCKDKKFYEDVCSYPETLAEFAVATWECVDDAAERSKFEHSCNVLSSFDACVSSSLNLGHIRCPEGVVYNSIVDNSVELYRKVNKLDFRNCSRYPHTSGGDGSHPGYSGSCRDYGYISTLSRYHCRPSVNKLMEETDYEKSCKYHIDNGKCLVFVLNRTDCDLRTLHRTSTDNLKAYQEHFPNFDPSGCHVPDLTSKDMCITGDYYEYLSTYGFCNTAAPASNTSTTSNTSISSTGLNTAGNCLFVYREVMCYTTPIWSFNIHCTMENYSEYLANNEASRTSQYKKCFDDIYGVFRNPCGITSANVTMCLSTSSFIINSSKTCGPAELAIYSTTLQCAKEKLDNNCTKEDVHDSLLKYSEVAGSLSSPIEFPFGGALCTNISNLPEVDICSNEKAILKIATSVLSAQSSASDVFKTCFGALRVLRHSLKVYINYSLNKACDLDNLTQVVISNAAAVSQQVPNIDLSPCQGIKYCPTFFGEGVNVGGTTNTSSGWSSLPGLSIYPSVLDCSTMLSVLSFYPRIPDDLKCRLYIESLRCMEIRSRLYGSDECTLRDFHDAIKLHPNLTMALNKTFKEECMSTLSDQPPICEDGQLIAQFATAICMPLYKDFEPSCLVKNVVADCVALQLGTSHIHCCKETIGEALQNHAQVILDEYPQHDFTSCEKAVEGKSSNSSDQTAMPMWPCQSQTEVFAFAATYCKMVVSRVSILHGQEVPCNLYSDLVICLKTASNYRGMSCTVADVTAALEQKPADFNMTSINKGSCTVEGEFPVVNPGETPICSSDLALHYHFKYSCPQFWKSTLRFINKENFCSFVSEYKRCMTRVIGEPCEDHTFTDVLHRMERMEYIGCPMDCEGKEEEYYATCDEYQSLEVELEGCRDFTDKFPGSSSESVCKDLWQDLVGCIQDRLFDGKAICKGYSVAARLRYNKHELEARGVKFNFTCDEYDFPSVCEKKSFVRKAMPSCKRKPSHCGGVEEIKKCIQDKFNSMYYYSYNCSISELDGPVKDILIEQNHRTCYDGDVRLTEDGEVEILQNNKWGHVCGTPWSDAEAEVVCRQLEYKHGFSSRRYNSPEINLYNVRCVGNESTLTDCLYDTESFFGCYEVATAVCMDEETELFISGGGNAGWIFAKRGDRIGHICDEGGWDDNDATVACQKLNYASGSSYSSVMKAPLPYSKAFRAQLYCQGYETSVDSCVRDKWRDEMADVSGLGQSNFYSVCSETNIASVFCYTKVRLHRPFKSSVGVVLIVEGQKERTICGVSFNDNAARVVCRQMGFPQGGKMLSYNPYDVGFSIGYKNVTCTGDEESFDECSYDVVDFGDCPSPPAVVVCDTDQEQLPDNVLRIGSEGKVEVTKYGVFGRICGNMWTNEQATIFCKALNFDLGLAGKICCDSSDVPQWYGDVSCPSPDSTWTQCSLSKPSPDTGSCSNEATAYCAYLDDVPAYTLHGPQHNSGGLYRTLRNESAPVCIKDFPKSAAALICRSKGFQDGEVVRDKSHQPATQTSLIWFVDYLHCAGSEAILDQCRMGEWRLSDASEGYCSPLDQVTITCYGKVRLHTTQQAGIVLVHKPEDGASVYGIICNDDFTDEAANVVCKELNFSMTGKRLPGWTYLHNYFRTSRGEVTCDGSEESILDCSNVSNKYCLQYAAVLCNNSTETERPLTEIKIEDGVVLTRKANIWGYFCAHEWSSENANVICKELKYDGGFARRLSRSGDVPLWVDRVNCTGSENMLQECPYNTETSEDCTGFNYVAGVRCYHNHQLEQYTFQPTVSESIGIPMVTLQGQTYALCDTNGFTNRDTDALCKHFGFESGNSRYGMKSSLKYWLTSLDCTGDDVSPLACASNWTVSNSCIYGTVGLECQGPSTGGKCQDINLFRNLETVCEESVSAVQTGGNNQSCNSLLDLAKCFASRTCSSAACSTWDIMQAFRYNEDVVMQWLGFENAQDRCDGLALSSSVCEDPETLGCLLGSCFTGKTGSMEEFFSMNVSAQCSMWQEVVNCGKDGVKQSGQTCIPTDEVYVQVAQKLLQFDASNCHSVEQYTFQPTVSESIGIPMVTLQGQTYALCDTNGFTNRDTDALCKHFGFESGNSRYGMKSSLKYWLTSLDCTGDDVSPLACASNWTVSNSCIYGTVGLECQGPSTGGKCQDINLFRSLETVCEESVSAVRSGNNQSCNSLLDLAKCFASRTCSSAACSTWDIMQAFRYNEDVVMQWLGFENAQDRCDGLALSSSVCEDPETLGCLLGSCFTGKTGSMEEFFSMNVSAQCSMWQEVVTCGKDGVKQSGQTCIPTDEVYVQVAQKLLQFDASNCHSGSNSTKSTPIPGDLCSNINTYSNFKHECNASISVIREDQSPSISCTQQLDLARCLTLSMCHSQMSYCGTDQAMMTFRHNPEQVKGWLGKNISDCDGMVLESICVDNEILTCIRDACIGRTVVADFNQITQDEQCNVLTDTRSCMASTLTEYGHSCDPIDVSGKLDASFDADFSFDTSVCPKV